MRTREDFRLSLLVPDMFIQTVGTISRPRLFRTAFAEALFVPLVLAFIATVL